MSETEEFVYPPIDFSRREIRLLRPIVSPTSISESPSNRDDSPRSIVQPDLTLKFELVTASLDERPVYTALSYVWGVSGSQPASILVNGKHFRISPSLDIALRHFQYEDVAPAIWIDSVSINQRDYDEKSHQVREMSTIYSKASKVLVWLGAATEDSDLVADIVYEFANQIRRHCNVSNPQECHLFDYLDFDSEEEVNSLLFKAIDNLGATRETAIQDFGSLCLSCIVGIPWWYRVWIIQEFVLSKQAIFQVGTRKMPFDDLSTTIMVFVLLKMFSSTTSSRLQSNASLAGIAGYDWLSLLFAYCLRQLRKKTFGDTNLYELLVNTYARPPWQSGVPSIAATVASDYIYGLVGLARDNFEQLGLVIDYNKPWQEIYTDVAQAFVRAEQLDMFAFCQNPSSTGPYHLPTWVPNWRARIQIPTATFKTVLDGQDSMLGHSLFSASGSSRQVAPRFQTTYLGRRSVRSMILKGIMVDSILEVKTLYARSCATRGEEREVLYGRLFREIELLCSKSQSLAPGLYAAHELSEAIWRMPIWDHEPDSIDKDNVIRRATHRSRARWQKSLQFFKSVEAYRLSEDFCRREIGLTRFQRALSWMRSTYYWLIHKYFYLRYFMPPVISRFQHLIGHWNSGILGEDSDIEDHSILGSNIYILGMEGGRPVRTFITRRGYIGMGPAAMEVGDSLYICFGARVPHVLRPRPNSKLYEFVGEAYVHGIMNGEIMKEDRRHQDFEIV